MLKFLRINLIVYIKCQEVKEDNEEDRAANEEGNATKQDDAEDDAEDREEVPVWLL